MKATDGAGSIYQRGDGRLVATLRYVDDAGVRRRRSLYSKTRPAALAALDDLRARVAAGAPVADSKLTVGEWLDEWLDVSVAASDRKASTVSLYRRIARLYLKPSVGSIPLRALRPRHIERMLLTLRQDSKSGAVRRSAYNLLRSALDVARRDDLLQANPAAKVPRPIAGSKEARWFEPEQVKALIRAMDKHRLQPLVILLAHTGLRVGEALALRWQDLDLEAGQLRVNGTLTQVGGAWHRTPPKSVRSNRSVPLTLAAVDALKARRKRQAVEQLAVGAAWCTSMTMCSLPNRAPR